MRTGSSTSCFAVQRPVNELASLRQAQLYSWVSIILPHAVPVTLLIAHGDFAAMAVLLVPTSGPIIQQPVMLQS